jgi:hypothetical protein
MFIYKMVIWKAIRIEGKRERVMNVAAGEESASADRSQLPTRAGPFALALSATARRAQPIHSDSPFQGTFPKRSDSPNFSFPGHLS